MRWLIVFDMVEGFLDLLPLADVFLEFEKIN